MATNINLHVYVETATDINVYTTYPYSVFVVVKNNGGDALTTIYDISGSATTLAPNTLQTFMKTSINQYVPTVPYNAPTVLSASFNHFDNELHMTFTGQVTSAGDAPLIDMGVVWNTTGTPTLSDNVVSYGSTGVEVYTIVYFSATASLNYARAYATNIYGTSYGSQLTAAPQLCLARGTRITMADRSTKPIEDIEYTDKILVWDFDHGRFESAYPLWIKKQETAACYNLLEFSNGSQLKTIDQHRIFNKGAGKFTYPMTDETPVGTVSYHVNDEEVRLIRKSVINEPVDYFNVITTRHINLFGNGILTSCRYNNIYPIVDMKFVKGQNMNTQVYGTLAQSKYYDGLRLAEQSIPVNDTIKYIARLEQFAR